MLLTYMHENMSIYTYIYASQVAWWLILKNLPASAGNVRDMGWIPGSRRSPAVGNDNPLQYSCLENYPEEPDGLQAMESPKNWLSDGAQHTAHTYIHIERYIYVCVCVYVCVHLSQKTFGKVSTSVSNWMKRMLLVYSGWRWQSLKPKVI